MIRLVRTLDAWNSPGFEQTAKDEIQGIPHGLLPLQQGLSQTSYVSDGKFDVVVINAMEAGTDIIIKAGIYYKGIIAGSCCADDPTPVEEQTEYCELQFEVNKSTAETSVRLLGE